MSTSGCDAACAQRQWITRLGLLEGMAMDIQAPIFKHKGEEMHICILIFNAYCLYMKYKICNPLVFLSKDISM